jgi:[ribosomal protein S5]-alanine N-acetyltransferase
MSPSSTSPRRCVDDLTVLETSRLILRKFRQNDLDDLCCLYADVEVRRYFPEGILSREQTKEELDWHISEGRIKPQLGLWATIHRSSGRFIGRCGLIPWIIEKKPEVEVAYMLAKDFWRQGLGAEVAAALVQHGFVRLRLARLIALVDPMNISSIRTAERVGFRFERKVKVKDMKAHLYSNSTDEYRSAD